MQVKGRLVYSTNRTTSVKEKGAAKLLHLIAPVYLLDLEQPFIVLSAIRNIININRVILNLID